MWHLSVRVCAGTWGSPDWCLVELQVRIQWEFILLDSSWLFSFFRNFVLNEDLALDYDIGGLAVSATFLVDVLVFAVVVAQVFREGFYALMDPPGTSKYVCIANDIINLCCETARVVLCLHVHVLDYVPYSVTIGMSSAWVVSSAENVFVQHIYTGNFYVWGAAATYFSASEQVCRPDCSWCEHGKVMDTLFMNVIMIV